MSALYHFTANDHWFGIGHGSPGIRVAGILPNAHPLIALPPHVWLTTAPSFAQPWSARPVPGSNCDRTEVRLEVVIPRADRANLLHSRQWLPTVRADWRADFILGVNPDEWLVYVGRVKPAWIRVVEHRAIYAQVIPA